MRVKPILHRGHVAFAHDVIMAALSFLAAVHLRQGELAMPGWDAAMMAIATMAFTLTAAAAFLMSRMYKGVWRYASVNDLMTLTRGATLTILIFTVLMFLVTRLQDLPRSVPVINWFVLLALLGGPRFLYRSWKDRRRSAKNAAGGTRVPVLLVGAGDEAELFIRATMAPDAEYRAIGLISDGGGRVGRNIHGIDVLGSTAELESVMARLKAAGSLPQRLIVTDHRLDGGEMRRLLDQADRLGLPLARIPRLTDLKDGVEDKLTIRPIAVEDLLGRPQTVLDREGMEALIKGKRVLVTGAGGSIGSELVRQISDWAPESLVLFEACEFNLYTIDLELAGRHPDLARHPVLGDVRDATRIDDAMRAHRPELVFHAAALKHVPMVEWNPDEGLLTNAVGTRNVADACAAHGVRLMVQISTDKAVNPTNVMGASKRVAEMYAQALDLSGISTRYVTVRFGNVLGSTGSVVPLFQKQLAEGGPLTVTDPEMTRYFMTVREAVELVLQASAFGDAHPDYRGKIFVLDMGEPVRIVHLARQMIRLAGLRPDIDIKIAFTGLRPGEKLFEEIFHGAEPPVATDREGILVATPRSVDVAELAAELHNLEGECRAHDAPAAIARLRRLVPEYAPKP
ncbi:polysaccharide biosynthesis protein [Magnetospirillum moscoviense]|uniref:Nucleotide sugar dehydratase n=1 Tax=Magnetospirillum moscoviense TaxID=1437059 RepID=A0A178MXQ6_9PROT|nr:nucleoside-diphosphate sugar epimerase/dehydratase [Magnetospirillum moscoviense]MBF0326105.1 polysaccharide biosynthesis protein [Alphaproteobacteria bacterium]OAN54199.1 nucleotide sugar dehydratase [Magnetospirillum moscoviense]